MRRGGDVGRRKLRRSCLGLKEEVRRGCLDLRYIVRGGYQRVGNMKGGQMMSQLGIWEMR